MTPKRPINDQEIDRAAKILIARGKNPTVEKIRSELGTGSYSTLAPLLKQWKAKNKDQSIHGELPAELIGSVRSIYEKIQSDADTKMGEFEAEKEVKIAELQSSIAEMNTLVTELKRQNTLNDERIHILAGQYSSALEDVAKHHSNEIVLETRLSDLNDRFDELKNTNAELKNDNRIIREQSEHYQQATANDRQQEREQFRFTAQQLQNQIDLSSQQIISLERIRQEAETENKELKQKVMDLESHKLMSQENINSLQLNLSTMQLKNESLTTERDISNNETKKLHFELNELNKHIAEMHIENRVLKESQSDSMDRLNVANDKIHSLIENNNVLLEEKSILSGRLMQIQKSEN
jgi:chromosome segregation ATPase